MIIHVVGVGMGPHHLTPEAVTALDRAAYVIAAAKSDDDPLLAVRQEICGSVDDLPLVPVADPPRDRDPDDYGAAVRDWHAARAAAYVEIIRSRPGDPAFLVWGDPSLYDSTIRVADRIAVELDAEVCVVPGISAPSLLAARHRIVLHEVGRPVHVTTARRMRESIDAGQRNVVVMLSGDLDALVGLEDWSIWWGANLGSPSERLIRGRVGEVIGDLRAAREAARTEAGWVMDVYLLRAVS